MNPEKKNIVIENLRTKNDELQKLLNEKAEIENLVNSIEKGITYKFGKDLLDSLVISVSNTLKADFAFIGKFNRITNTITTLSMCEKNKLYDNIEYNIFDSPSENLLINKSSFVTENLRHKYPKITFYTENNIDSYIGVPLLSSKNEPLGVLAVLIRGPLGNPTVTEVILELFASKAASELERLATDKNIIKDSPNKIDLIDYSSEGIIVASGNNIKYSNDRAKQILGYKSEELLSFNFLEYIHSDDVSIVMERLKARESGNSTEQRLAFRYKHKNSEFRWLETRSLLIKWNDSYASISFLLDITETKNKLDYLINNNEEYRCLFQSQEEGVLIWKLNQDMMPEICLEANLFSCEKLGYSHPKLLSLHYSDYFIDDDREQLEHNISLLKSNDVIVFDSYIRTIQNISIPVSISLKYEKINAETYLIVKFSEKIIQEKSESNMKIEDLSIDNMFRTIPFPLFVKDIDGRFIFVNDSFADYFNIKAQDYIGYTLEEIYKNDFGVEYHKNDIKAMSGVKTQIIESNTIDGRGDSQCIISYKTPILNNEGKTTGLVGIIVEITERKKLENELKFSNDKLSGIFNQSPNAIVIIDAKTNQIEDVNYQASYLSGYTVEQLKGKVWFRLNIFSDREGLKNINCFLKKYNEIDDIEIEFTARNKRKLTCLVSVKTINVGDKKFYIIMVKDITERKSSLIQLIEQEEMFSKVFKMSPQAMAVINANTYIIKDINEKLTDLIGYSKEELIGKPFTQFDFAEVSDYQFDLSLFKNIEFELRNYEMKLISKKGRKFWVLISTTTFLLNNEPHFILIINDIDRQKKNEQRIKEFNKELEQKVTERTLELTEMNRRLEDSNIELKLLNEKVAVESLKLINLNNKLADSEKILRDTVALKDRFLSLLAHDLKNPIHAIQLNSEVLMINSDRMDLASIQTGLKQINKVSIHLSELIGNMLLLSKVQRGRYEFKPENSNLPEMIERVLSVLHQNIINKRIEVDLSDLRIKTVHCDKFMIETVLRNLIANAIKFSKEGSQVKISSEINDGYYHIIVSDNGIGISEKDIDKLFRLDVVYSTNGTSQEKGTGLGLIICKEFIDRHNGTIAIESTLGKRTEITVCLPNNTKEL